MVRAYKFREIIPKFPLILIFGSISSLFYYYWFTPFSISNSSELSSGVARTTLLNYPDPLLGSNVTVNKHVVLAPTTTYAGFILNAESDEG